MPGGKTGQTRKLKVRPFLVTRQYCAECEQIKDPAGSLGLVDYAAMEGVELDKVKAQLMDELLLNSVFQVGHKRSGRLGWRTLEHDFLVPCR